MNVKVYMHPKYQDTLWNALAYKAILAECARKRYDVELLRAPSLDQIDFDAVYAGEEKRILIGIGTNDGMTLPTLRCLAENHVHMILLNYESSIFTAKYSKILLDYRDGMRKIISYLTACGRTSIALYGINPNSPTDMIKNDFFAEYLRERGQNPTWDIYYNYGSQEGCGTRFLENAQNYSAVICANDIVALALVRRLKAQGLRVPEDLYVVSFGSTLLAAKSNPTISSVGVDHEELGRQAVLAFSFLYKNPCDITLTLKVDPVLTVRASTDFKPENHSATAIPILPHTPDIDFYNDPVTKRLFDAEKLLLACDDLDFGILDGILAGETYPHIAERLFTSENVISYRIKRMCKTSGCNKKSELVALLAPYLQ